MKNVIACLGCGDLTVNGKPERSLLEVTKLMIATRFNPESVVIVKHVCPNCRINFPKEFCDKLMEDTPLVSS